MSKRRYNIFFFSSFEEHPRFYISSVGFWNTRRMVKLMNKGITDRSWMGIGYYFAEKA